MSFPLSYSFPIHSSPLQLSEIHFLQCYFLASKEHFRIADLYAGWIERYPSPPRIIPTVHGPSVEQVSDPSRLRRHLGYFTIEQLTEDFEGIEPVPSRFKLRSCAEKKDRIDYAYTIERFPPPSTQFGPGRFTIPNLFLQPSGYWNYSPIPSLPVLIVGTCADCLDVLESLFERHRRSRYNIGAPFNPSGAQVQAYFDYLGVKRDAFEW